jgi:microcystin-dependent protein
MSVIGNDHLGWMKCDGRVLNVNDYYLLWRVIGYSFGSNGSSNTFKLPNAAGRVPGVVGQGVDSNANFSTLTVSLGDMVGEYTHTLTINEMPSHTHGSADVSGNINGNGVTDISGAHFHTGTTDAAGYAASSHSVLGGAGTGTADNTGDHTHTFTTNTTGTHAHRIYNTGGSNYHNNVQPMIGLGNMFIFSGKYMAPSDAAVPFAGYPYLSNSQIL